MQRALTMTDIFDGLLKLAEMALKRPACCCHNRPPAIFEIEWHKSLKEKIVVNIPLTTEQRVRVTIKPRTAGGKDVQIDGPVAFMLPTDDAGEALVGFESIDERSAFLWPMHAGTYDVTVSADAKIGPEVVKIEQIIRIDATDPLADHLDVEVGTPEPIPTP